MAVSNREESAMGVWAQCKHFRRVKPASQILAGIFAQTTHADISQALNKIVEDENKQRDEESGYKRSQAAAGKSAWAYKPVMSDYCALHEAKGEYHIAEVLNAGLQCQKFEAGKPDRKACSDCTHRKPADGAAKDKAAEELYSRMIIQATSTKASASQPEALLKAARDGASARKAFELASIYSAKGVLASPPTYADTCGLLSAPPDEFVICAIYNSHNTCDKWQGIATAAAPAGASATVATPTHAPVAPVPAMPGMPTFPPTAGAPPDVLVPGAVPLTRTLAAKFTAGLAWILDVTIPSEVAALVQSSLVADWSKGDPKTIAETQQFAAFVDSIAGYDIETRDALREERQAEFVVGLRQEQDPAAKALVVLYDRANAPIAMGNPPLTREIANCYFDLIGLVQALQSGLQWQPLPDQAKLAYAQVLATQYPSLHPAHQQWFGSLPRGWTQIRAMWKNCPPEQREQLRQQILSSFGQLAWQAPSMQQAAGMSPYGQPQPSPYGVPPPPAAPGAPVAAPGHSTDELLNKILESDKAEEERLEKENPELAVQAKLQNSARNAQLLSNIMQMRHESMMAIARNIR